MLYPRDEWVRHLYGWLFRSNLLVPVCTLRLVGAHAGKESAGEGRGPMRSVSFFFFTPNSVLINKKKKTLFTWTLAYRWCLHVRAVSSRHHVDRICSKQPHCHTEVIWKLFGSVICGISDVFFAFSGGRYDTLQLFGKCLWSDAQSTNYRPPCGNILPWQKRSSFSS